MDLEDVNERAEGGMVNGTGNETLNYLNITLESPIQFAEPLYGYCVPFLIVITIVANTLVVAVLAKRHMRSPTNTVLLAMAISDMFTVLFSAPWIIYMYTFGNHYKPFNPVAACYAWTFMQEVLPNLFHTASIWLTLALAVQRYIYVCHPTVAVTWCTMPKVLKGISWIYASATLHQSTRFLDRTYKKVEIEWHGQIYPVCVTDFASWVYAVSLDLYFNFYYWFRVIFIHVIPCTALVVLNTLLFRAMREAQRNREQLFNCNSNNSRNNDCRRMRDSNCTTMMLIVVVTVFLVTEIPLAILTVLHIISSSFNDFLNYDIVNVLIVLSNFFIVASYPVNFAIYCGMSRQFRETFRDLFIRKAEDRRNGSNRYSMVNGPRTCTNETVL